METWGPLLGVVVGAILGGAAQVINANIADRRNREANQREVRRRIYAEFLRCCSELRGVSINLQSALDAKKATTAHIAEVTAATTALDRARAELILVAPEDTYAIGDHLANLHVQLTAQGKDQGLLEETADTFGVFTQLAKRDLR